MKKNKQKYIVKKNPAMITGKIILIVLTIIFPIIMNCLAGAGLIVNSESYGEKLTMIGKALIASGVLMMLATILCIFKKNILSIILSIIGFGLCMTMLYLLSEHARTHGWSDPYTLEPIRDMYISRILPNIAPFLLNITLSLIQFFSYECAEKRREKKRIRYEKDNSPTPSIIDE